jgi:hypothetical protein
MLSRSPFDPIAHLMEDKRYSECPLTEPKGNRQERTAHRAYPDADFPDPPVLGTGL